MTNLVVWKRPAISLKGLSDNRRGELWGEYASTESIWMVADSRATDPTRISDQATKIFELEATTHKKIAGHGFQDMWKLSIGFGYTGAIFPALMTFSALRPLLANLAPSHQRLPTLLQVANLTAKLLEQYVRNASRAYSEPPHVIVVLTGMSEFEGALTAIRVGPIPLFKDFEYRSSVLDLTKVHVFGEDVPALQTEISNMRKQANASLNGLEPKIALERRIAAAKHSTVGGTLQYGVHDGSFKSYAVCDKTKKSFLGIDLDAIARDVGFEILLDGLKSSKD